MPLPSRYDPYVLASDGSTRNGVAAWAYVTGGGWCSSGQLESSNTMLVEWMALCEGLRIFPTGSRVTAIVDNKPCVQAIHDLIAHVKKPRPKWMSPAALRVGRKVLKGLDVEVQWVRRNEHPLNVVADRLCGGITQERTSPLAVSAQAVWYTASYLAA